MHTVVEPSEAESVTTVLETPATMTTTLYDLIATVQAAVGPDDDALVVAAVLHMLRSGRATWRGDIVADVN